MKKYAIYIKTAITQSPEAFIVKLGNHEFSVVLDSGILGFNGRGWPPEQLAILLGLLKPSELTAISKTVTFEPHRGNFRWWKPWESIRYLGGGNYVNTYGLTNPGIGCLTDTLGRFCERVGFPIISILPPSPNDARRFAVELLGIRPAPKAIEFNLSCVNHAALDTDELVYSINEMRSARKWPVILKMGYDQEFVEIANTLYFVHDCAHLINSVRFTTVFPEKPSPLKGGGGVSGPIIFELAQVAVETLRTSGYSKPIIGGGGVNSVERARHLIGVGANAIALGTTVHLRPHLVREIKQALEE